MLFLSERNSLLPFQFCFLLNRKRKIKLIGGDINDLNEFVSVLDTGLKGSHVDSKALDIG
ncbi:MAG TPA: hypothetical protein VHJ38_06620 [Nitrososphaeraceae archaeon]|jgi:hypothetical protein|nr:hypothetical protein [Nitrososphaeraceae archaeon]